MEQNAIETHITILQNKVDCLITRNADLEVRMLAVEHYWKMHENDADRRTKLILSRIDDMHTIITGIEMRCLEHIPIIEKMKIDIAAGEKKRDFWDSWVTKLVASVLLVLFGAWITYLFK